MLPDIFSPLLLFLLWLIVVDVGGEKFLRFCRICKAKKKISIF
jgi:lipopolysaccharide/colanic/teichoic acid biosynthesis glycosyltransferase